MITAASCQCSGRCGDDENVTAGRVLGCATYRATRTPAALQNRVEVLQAMLAKTVDLLDRMEPDVAEENRASDEEWIAIKAEAVQTLKGTP